MQPVHSLLLARQSIFAFDSKPIDDQVILSLFEAASWAPSSFNHQPWRFIYAKKTTVAFDQLVDALSESNRIWVPQAPLLILSLAHRLDPTGNPSKFYLHDTGMAVANLTFQAVSLGLQVHPMGGFSSAKVREAFAIPEQFDTGALLAVGYPGTPEHLPEFLKQRQLKLRTRRPVDTFAFENEFKSLP